MVMPHGPRRCWWPAILVPAILVIVTALSSVQPARADDASKLALIKQLLALTNAEASIEQTLGPLGAALDQQLASRFPEQSQRIRTITRETMTEVLREFSPEMQLVTAQIWATSFTEEDLQAVLDFYRSPAGTRFLKRLPEVAVATTNAMIPTMERLQATMIQRLTARLAQEGITH